MRRCSSLAAAAVVGFVVACGQGADGQSAQPSGDPGTEADLNKLSTYDSIPPAPAIAAPTVTVRARSITLSSRGGGRQAIEGTLIKGPGAPPDTVWVWAYYTAPRSGNSGSWSDAAIPVARPFARGDTARFVARGSAHWMGNEYAPKSGYYARVSASPVSADAAKVPSPQREYSPAGALRVTTRP